jgi:hypothetical protein
MVPEATVGADSPQRLRGHKGDGELVLSVTSGSGILRLPPENSAAICREEFTTRDYCGLALLPIRFWRGIHAKNCFAWFHEVELIAR